MTGRFGGIGLLLVLGAGTVRAQTVSVRLAGDLSSLVGVPFDVPLIADWSGRADKLGSFALTLRWDAAVLRFDGGVDGTFGAVTANQDSVAQGILKISSANPTGVAGLIILGVGRFTALTASTTTVTLELTELFSAPPDFADVLASAQPQNGLYCPARGYWGDPDLDRDADSRDALIALMRAVGLDVSAFPEIGLADVDGDGVVGARDALGILSHAVGLPVDPFRVMRVAVGSCGSEVTTTYALIPGSETILVNQELRFQLRAMSGGAERVLTDVSWRSSSPAVLSVDPFGVATALAPGTATVVGKSGSRDSATATLTVVSRRTRHLVRADAAAATNHLGTAAFPFALLGEAARFVRNGDTIDMLPGRYDEAVTIDSSVVILGRTIGPDRAVLVGVPQFDSTALTLNGPRTEVHDLTIDGAFKGILTGTVDTLVLDSLRYVGRTVSCGSAAIFAKDIEVLILRRSQLVGDGSGTGCASGLTVNGNARRVEVEDAEINDFGYYGVYVNNADSVIVRRSAIHDNGYYGLDVRAYQFGGFGRVMPAPSLALVVEDSRLLRNGFGGLSGFDLRSARIAGNVIVDRPSVGGEFKFQPGVGGDALFLSGMGAGGGFARLIRDSVDALGNNWINAYGLDSVLVDSVRVRNASSGFFSDVDFIRVTRSSFTDIVGGTALSVSAGPGVLGVVVDSVTMQGRSSCSQCYNGVSTVGTPVTVNRLAADNLFITVQVADSSGNVTNSSFTNVYYGVYGYAFSAVPPLRVSNVTMTDAQFGVYSSSRVLTVDGSSFTRGSYGVWSAYGTSVDSVRGSRFTDNDYGVYLGGSRVYAASDTAVRPRYAGIYLYGAGVVGDSAVAVNNAITCSAVSGADGIDAYYTSIRIEGNVIAGCDGGIYVENASYAMSATVRGDTVRGSRRWGIRGVNQDSLRVLANLVEDGGPTVCCFFTNPGISVDGSMRQRALVQGNTVRRMKRAGITISINTLDTTTAVVDSNAVSQIDTVAVEVQYGRLLLTRNNIQNNLLYGLDAPFFHSPAVTHVASGNLFAGNVRYGVRAVYDSVDATGNWWGDPNGPRCSRCNPASVAGDSVSGRVGAASPLPNPPMDVPPLAPPALPVTTAWLWIPPAAATPTRVAGLVAADRPSAGGPAVDPLPGASAALAALGARPSPWAALVRQREADRAERAQARAAWEQALREQAAQRAAQDSVQAAERDRRRAAQRGTP